MHFRLLAVSMFLFSFELLAQVPVGPRSDWAYEGGYFHAQGGTEATWSETFDGREQFLFRHVARNNQYVEMHDASRNISVRLYAQAMYIKTSSDQNFRFFRAGHWDDRRLYIYQSNGQTAYLLLQPAEIWRWVRPGQANVYLRETLRNDGQIQLYNARDRYTLSLLNDQLWIKQDGGQWAKYTDAKWAL